MSEHRAHIAWQRGDKPFTYDEYSREHLITFSGGARVTGSGAMEYRGDASLPNPEEMLVAALSTCHMLTFLAICARRGLTVDRYEDDAVGHLAKNAEGRLAVTTCELRPSVTFAAGVAVDADELKRLHDQSHRGCFIAASVKTEVYGPPRVIYAVLKALLAFAARVFFREIEVVGQPAKGTRGRLFVANHWNGIIDPLVILTTMDFQTSPIAKSTLFSMPGLKQILAVAGAVPVTRRRDAPGKSGNDNDAVFDKIAAHLGAGGNVLIFPEGTSHSEPQVLPLKSGAARMLARAHEQGGRGLSLQAVALDFDDKATFRSRVVITYGPVHDVDALATQLGGGEPCVQALVELATTDLDKLVVSGRSQGELMLVRAAAEILANEAPEHDPAAQAEIARTIMTEARALGPEDPTYRKVADAVATYEAARRAVGLTEEQVARNQEPVGLGRLLRGLGLLLLAPFALLGAILYFVPYRLPRLGVRIAKGEKDVVSTYKLAIGLVVFPLWMALLLWLGIRYSPDSHGAILHVALILGTPWAALRWLDRLDDRRGLRLLKTASSAGVRELARLRLLRSHAVDALVARGAPQRGGHGDGERH